MQNVNVLKSTLIKKALDNFKPLKQGGRFKLTNQIGEMIIHNIQQQLLKKSVK